MKKILLLTCLCSVTLSFGKTFYMQIAKNNNSPSLETIIQESLLSPPPPSYSLSAFNSVTPTKADYLIKIRAIGNLKTIMDNNPNWERAKLQQFIKVNYADSNHRGHRDHRGEKLRKSLCELCVLGG